MDDGDVPYDTSILGDDSDANSSDPSTRMDLCNDGDATSVGSNPNNMVNAMLPSLHPRTNHISMDDTDILAQ